MIEELYCYIICESVPPSSILLMEYSSPSQGMSPPQHLRGVYSDIKLFSKQIFSVLINDQL